MKSSLFQLMALVLLGLVVLLSSPAWAQDYQCSDGKCSDYCNNTGSIKVKYSTIPPVVYHDYNPNGNLYPYVVSAVGNGRVKFDGLLDGTCRFNPSDCEAMSKVSEKYPEVMANFCPSCAQQNPSECEVYNEMFSPVGRFCEFKRREMYDCVGEDLETPMGSCWAYKNSSGIEAVKCTGEADNDNCPVMGAGKVCSGDCDEEGWEKFKVYVGFLYPEQAAVLKAKHQKEQTWATGQIDGKTVDLSGLDFNYRVSGKAPWKPVQVFNDGNQTFIRMPDSASKTEAPVLLAMKGKREQIVNYRVHNNTFVVDGLFENLALISGVGRDQVKVTIKIGR